MVDRPPGALAGSLRNGNFFPLRGPKCGAKGTAMTTYLLTHPAATFAAGIILAVAGLGFFVNCSAAPNLSKAEMEAYRKQVAAAGPTAPGVGSEAEHAAIERFKAFLQNIGDAASVRENTRKVYADDAFLDDTLVSHHGAAEIEAYFVKTSGVMTQYQVTIDDVARSGSDHYFRWTMVFAAPALAGGKPVHSTGISQVRFNTEGKVAFHQDFWDSGKNFYRHLPVAGGVIGFIRKRLH